MNYNKHKTRSHKTYRNGYYAMRKFKTARPLSVEEKAADSKSKRIFLNYLFNRLRGGKGRA